VGGVQARYAVLDLLGSLGVALKEGKTVGLYGLSMVGKSVLAAMVAREWAGPEGTAVFFGTEPHYADQDYRELVARFLPRSHYINYCHSVEDVYRYLNVVRRYRFEGRVALVLDSLSYVAMREAAEWHLRGVTDPRVVSARVIPVLYTVASAFKSLVIEKKAVGLVVMHAGSMAGAGKYRGLTDLRPSMASRVAHSLDYLLLLEAEGPSLDSPRRLTLVASRLSPEHEGKSLRFRFRGATVEPVEEKQEGERRG